jgi:chorismate mutase
MALRGVRGATTAGNNTPEAILAATRELLEEIVAATTWPRRTWPRHTLP